MTAVLMVDDHAMFREGLKLTIARLAPTLDICLASSGNEAISVLESRADISCVIMDYYLPDIGGSALLRRLRQLRPGIRILVMSASEDSNDRDRALMAGARGFLHKSASSRMLLAALEQIQSPHLPDAPSARAAAAAQPTAQADEIALLSELTPRQSDVLRLICAGIGNREIALQLDVAEKTVKTHITAILSTLGVQNRTQATLLARRGGLLGKPK
ncbi:response regulator transcription factor [Achromobacter insolitus]|uniref:response regulator transcription factor n=1 Tax=Achromobacter insolitus TaxID=217204 RepID=UPI000536E901|nr:response regulator transcription factor [Achromobacter insolitus]AVG41144.1 DNA-binding response regulator [Achromobacter insolitus]